MELPHGALQQVDTLDGQAHHVLTAEQLRRAVIKTNVGQFGFFLASRR